MERCQSGCNVPVLKTGVAPSHRGFESLSLRGLNISFSINAKIYLYFFILIYFLWPYQRNDAQKPESVLDVQFGKQNVAKKLQKLLIWQKQC